MTKRCSLFLLLLACGVASAQVDLVGLWRYRQPGGAEQTLALAAGSRFGWRDDLGHAAAGSYAVEGDRLVFETEFAQRDFGFRLSEDGLVLEAPPVGDRLPPEGDLAELAPPIGAPAATWRRPGWEPDPPELPVVSLADLALEWQIAADTDAVDRLTLTPSGTFEYIGPSGAHASGEASYAGGLLELRSGAAVRRFAARLRAGRRGASLRLQRLPSDSLQADSDLVELPPCLTPTATWRPTEPEVTPSTLPGKYLYSEPSGLEYGATFQANGDLVLSLGQRQLVAGQWRLGEDGLEVALPDGEGQTQIRRLSAGALGADLVLNRAVDDTSAAPAEALVPWLWTNTPLRFRRQVETAEPSSGAAQVPPLSPGP